MPIEICGCYHNGEIWSPCDEHAENIIKSGTLTDPGWWQDTAGGSGEDWTTGLNTRFTGPRIRLQAHLLEHNIDNNEFWFISDKDLHRMIHASPHPHEKINYSFSEVEKDTLEDIKIKMHASAIPASKAGEEVGLVIAQAQARIVPDWQIAIHLAIKHDMPINGLLFDGHTHSSEIPDEVLENHLRIGHMNDEPSINIKLQHRIYHDGFAHLIHNKLSSLISPNHEHYGHDVI